MAVKARIRMTLIEPKTCAFGNGCKYTKANTKSETKEFHGDLKVSADILEDVGIEASFGGKLETFVLYQNIDEFSQQKGEVAYFVGLASVLETTIDSVDVSAYDPATPDTEDQVDCQRDRYNSGRIVNVYMRQDHHKTIWLPVPAGSFGKRQGEGNDWEDVCFYTDANNEIVVEECL